MWLIEENIYKNEKYILKYNKCSDYPHVLLVKNELQGWQNAYLTHSEFIYTPGIIKSSQQNSTKILNYPKKLKQKVNKSTK